MKPVTFINLLFPWKEEKPVFFVVEIIYYFAVTFQL